MPIRTTIVALLLLAGVGHATGEAQVSVLTHYGAPTVLRLPANTRALSLGDAAAVVIDEPDAAFYNPAMLASAVGIGVSAQRFGDTGTFGGFSAAARLGPGTLGAGARFLDQPADAAEAADPIGGTHPLGDSAVFRGGTANATSVAATLGYGLSFGDPSPTWLDDVRVGIAAHLAQQVVGDPVRGGARAVIPGLSVGAAVELASVIASLELRNLGPLTEPSTMPGFVREIHPPPTRIELGVTHPSRRLGPLDVVTTATLAALEGPDSGPPALAPAIGAELSYWPVRGRTFVARIGARHDPFGILRPITLGAGFEADDFAIDYAFQSAGELGHAHRVGLRWWGGS